MRFRPAGRADQPGVSMAHAAILQNGFRVRQSARSKLQHGDRHIEALMTHRVTAGSPSPILEGAHVRLEPLSLAHVPALAAIGLDPDLWQWTVSQVRTPEDMAR